MANTLWDTNTSDTASAVVETGRLTGPAAFAADDYHLGPGSAALEQGLDAGVSDDLDGESRPQPVGTSPDPGADESPLAGLLAAPVVSSRQEGNGIELRWTQTQVGVARYEVYRSTNPYFTPDGGSLLDGDVPAPGVGKQATFNDPFGEPRVNYYYLVLAVSAGEAKSPASNRVAAFHFGLTPGAQ